mmetsp:Transcript_22235/g.56628  ORF Transcript_22235/g.56628 Transcript_22235/m.56628 type:complete len:205 (-) Transcript_22235:2081-2695(-)
MPRAHPSAAARSTSRASEPRRACTLALWLRRAAAMRGVSSLASRRLGLAAASKRMVITSAPSGSQAAICSGVLRLSACRTSACAPKSSTRRMWSTAPTAASVCSSADPDLVGRSQPPPAPSITNTSWERSRLRASPTAVTPLRVSSVQRAPPRISAQAVSLDRCRERMAARRGQSRLARTAALGSASWARRTSTASTCPRAAAK